MKPIHLFFILSLFFVFDVSLANSYYCGDLICQFNKSTMVNQKLEKAQECINKRNFTAAKNYISGALKLDPNNSKAKELLAICNNEGNQKVSSSSNSHKSNLSKSSPELKASKTNLSFSADGGTETINISGQTDWSITVWPEGWGHLTRNGNTLTLRVDKNSSSSSRSDSFFIKAGTKELKVSISQNGSKATPYLALSKTSLSFTSYGGTETISISSNNPWKIKVNVASWVHITSSGNTLTIKIDNNTTSSQRSDYFVIEAGGEEKRVYIKQSGRYSNTSTNSSPSSTYYPPYTNTYSSYSTNSSYTNTYSSYRKSYDRFFMVEYQYCGDTTPYGLLLGGGYRQGVYGAFRLKFGDGILEELYDSYFNDYDDSSSTRSNGIICGGYLVRPFEWMIFNVGGGIAIYDIEAEKRGKSGSDIGAIIDAGLMLKIDWLVLHVGYQKTFTEFDGSSIVLGIGFAL